MTTCRYCGGNVKPGVTKCRHCGEWLDDKARREAKNEMPEVVKFVLALVLVVFALMVVGAIVSSL